MADAEPETHDHAVRRVALDLGFDVVGVARAEPLGPEHDRYLAFVERGMHGEMRYLAENLEARRRVDDDAILPGAKSVVCVGKRYARDPESERDDPPLAKAIARYARGRDYHVHLRKRVRRLAAFVRTLAPGTRARPLCDIEPIMERVWATRAGLGFVGKNGLVITPGQGSYQLLGEVVTTLELVPDTPMTERCGSCTRCLDACPTAAFEAPFVLDPRRCIAYLTIEAEGAPPDELRAGIGEHLFGCDVCQEVCPFNRTAAPDPRKTRRFEPHARWGQLGLDDLVAQSGAEFAAMAEGSPLHRAGRAGLARNAALVAANRLASGAEGARADEARRALAAAGRHDEEPVREIASWGRRRGLEE